MSREAFPTFVSIIFIQSVNLNVRYNCNCCISCFTTNSKALCMSHEVRL